MPVEFIISSQAGIQNVVFSTLEKIPNDVKDALPAVEKDMIIPSYEGKAAIAVRNHIHQMPHTAGQASTPMGSCCFCICRIT